MEELRNCVMGLVAYGVSTILRPINLQLLLSVSLLLCTCFGQLLPGGAATSAAVLAPSDREMLLLKASGGMFGGSENAFGQHAFSTKTSQGLVLWQDTSPDRVVYINPENKTYFEVSLSEYLEDNRGGKRSFGHYQSSQVKAVQLSDGTAAKEITYKGPASRRHRAELGSLGSANSSEQYSLSNRVVSGTGSRDATQVELAQVICLSNVKLSAAMNKVWCSIMNCEPKLGFPVILRGRASHREQRELSQKANMRDLFVYHSLKLVPLDKKRFLIPQGFKKARDKSALYFSESGVLESNDLDDLFRGKVR
ncbi:hypothetical protein KA344_12820 [bacterium]|jgi:hypothetical protein|nr:hypothetical protein [bacterium]